MLLGEPEESRDGLKGRTFLPHAGERLGEGKKPGSRRPLKTLLPRSARVGLWPLHPASGSALCTCLCPALRREGWPLTAASLRLPLHWASAGFGQEEV